MRHRGKYLLQHSFFYEDTLLQNSHLKAPCARFKKAELYGLEIALPTHYLLGNAPFSLYGASLLYTQCYIPYLHTLTIFQELSHYFTSIAESFYSVKYGSSNITSFIPSNHLLCFMSFQMQFFNNLQMLAFFYSFGFNLKKKMLQKK